MIKCARACDARVTLRVCDTRVCKACLPLPCKHFAQQPTHLRMEYLVKQGIQSCLQSHTLATTKACMISVGEPENKIRTHAHERGLSHKHAFLHSRCVHIKYTPTCAMAAWTHCIWTRHLASEFEGYPSPPIFQSVFMHSV